MKKLLLLAISASLCLIAAPTSSQLLKKIKEKAKQRADQKTDQAIDKGLDKAEDAGKKKDNTTEKKTGTQDPANGGTDQAGSNAATAPAAFKTYANYDFVPGDKVLFEDNFTDDQDGEFPSRWDLENGQGVLNKMSGEKAFFLTDGNYARVHPLLKSKAYLTRQFTVEYDTYYKAGSYGIILFFLDEEGHDIGKLFSSTEGIAGEFPEKSLNGTLPEGKKWTDYNDKWHHISVAYKNKQLKVYVDEDRVLVMPNCNITPAGIGFGGIGDLEKPIIFKNIRVADGGGMNMLGKKFTDAKIITHGINFNYNMATIKPESMGTLNMIVKVMQENPDIKFEVGGHTDSDGEDSYNLKLSQQRADAVRTQLIIMGIDALRLTAKGYGESKPVSDNNSPEGKANNRRVEFVKL